MNRYISIDFFNIGQYILKCSYLYNIFMVIYYLHLIKVSNLQEADIRFLVARGCFYEKPLSSAGRYRKSIPEPDTDT